MSYLRAIGVFGLMLGTQMLTSALVGVIILSAVLKRRMILADKAKSLFISKLVLSLLSNQI